jgi:uncharacterized membrane protein YkoI
MTTADWKRFEAQARDENEMKSRRQIELARQAKITMQQAVRIATDRQSGTVMECSLARERDMVFYRVLIVSGDEAETISTRVLVDANNGQIIKSFRD